MCKYLFCLVFLSFLIPPWALAFDNKSTHRILTERAIENTKDFKNYLEVELGIEEGVKKELNNGKDAYSITRWLQEGAYEEDKPACRASNHFHNPLRSWTDAELTDPKWLVDIWCTVTSPYNTKYSNLVWATGFINKEQDPQIPAVNNEIEIDNGRNWEVARKQFYSSLIEKDPQIREEHFAETFRTLGYVLHLLQDMAVPAHTRNDFSQGHSKIIGCPDEGGCFPIEWIGNPFEGYVRDNFNKEILPLIAGDISKPFAGNKTLTNFWDTDNVVSSPQIGFNIGLAEYSNSNFISYGTIFKEPTDEDHYFEYPTKESITDSVYPDQPNQQLYEVWAQDNELDKVIYITKKNDDGGEVIDKFLKPRYILYGADWDTIDRYDLKLTLDNQCYLEYAQKLIPRAIGYSATLIDFFFRGKLEVDAVPLIFGEYVYGVVYFVKNITEIEDTETGEPLGAGTFSLVLDYTSVNGSEDGYESLDMRVDQPITGLEFEKEAMVPLYFESPMPLSNLPNLNKSLCRLAFVGELGDEKGAVVGKIFTMAGDLLLNEEWDDIGGNYNWLHTASEDTNDNGYNENYVVNNVLIKESIRTEGDEARFNSSNFDLTTDVNFPNGLLVTPHTYIEYKIDEMYIVNKPVAPEGYTNDYQVVWLEFNDGLIIQLSYDSFVLWSSTTAYWQFEPGYLTIDNIYGIFEFYQITIPETLYLKRVSFSQQLLGTEEEGYVEQHMEVDFFRIIEGQPAHEEVVAP